MPPWVFVCPLVLTNTYISYEKEGSNRGNQIYPHSYRAWFYWHNHIIINWLICHMMKTFRSLTFRKRFTSSPSARLTFENRYGVLVFLEDSPKRRYEVAIMYSNMVCHYCPTMPIIHQGLTGKQVTLLMAKIQKLK